MRIKIYETLSNNYIMTIKLQQLNDINQKQLIRDQLISIATENAKELGWFIENKTQNILILKKNVNLLTSIEQDTSTLIDLILNIH